MTYTLNSIDRPRFLPHAVARMTELRVSESEVRSVLASPLRTEPGGLTHPQGRRVHVGRRIRVITDSGGRVVTVCLQTPELYVHGVDMLPTVAAATSIPHQQFPTAA